MNYNLLLVLSVVVLFFVSGFFIISSSAKESELIEAKLLGASVREHFELIDKRCRVRNDDFDRMRECFEELNDKLRVVVDVEEDEFEDYDADDNKTGYLIVVNEGRQTMNSSKFFLLKNRQLVDRGCVIPGAIDSGYTCRLEFSSVCEEGDVLEVRYDDQRAYLRTC